MKTLKAAISLLLLSGCSALADDVAPTSAASSLPMITAMTSGSKPAVDGLNGELWLYGGAGMGNAQSLSPTPGLAVFRHTGSNLQAISGVTGAITAPVGHDFGFQLDLNTGTFKTAVQGSVACHFFGRNPDTGLIGIYGAGQYWAKYGGKSTWNIGPELEKYFVKFTLGGTLGAQGFDFLM